jgi:hypothetical protein
LIHENTLYDKYEITIKKCLNLFICFILLPSFNHNTYFLILRSFLWSILYIDTGYNKSTLIVPSEFNILGDSTLLIFSTFSPFSDDFNGAYDSNYFCSSYCCLIYSWWMCY